MVLTATVAQDVDALVVHQLANVALTAPVAHHVQVEIDLLAAIAVAPVDVPALEPLAPLLVVKDVALDLKRPFNWLMTWTF